MSVFTVWQCDICGTQEKSNPLNMGGPDWKSIGTGNGLVSSLSPGTLVCGPCWDKLKTAVRLMNEGETNGRSAK